MGSKRIFKRAISVALSVAMLISIVPTATAVDSVGRVPHLTSSEVELDEKLLNTY